MDPKQIAAEFGPMVSTVCRRMLQDPEVARDAAQEVWVDIIQSLPSFRGEAKMSTWIFAVLRRSVIRRAQKERLYSTRFLRGFFSGETREIPRERTDDHGLWIKEMCDKCLTGILHCLDNQTRLAYIFRDIAELNYDEIAGILEMDAATVRKTVSRARRKLRDFLNNQCSLQNPAGACRCRMKTWVDAIDLPAEYEKIRQTVRRVTVFKASEQALPGKDFWLKYR